MRNWKSIRNVKVFFFYGVKHTIIKINKWCSHENIDFILFLINYRFIFSVTCCFFCFELSHQVFGFHFVMWQRIDNTLVLNAICVCRIGDAWAPRFMVIMTRSIKLIIIFIIVVSSFFLFIVDFPCHVEFKHEQRDTNEVLNLTCYLFKFIYARRVNMASIGIILLFVCQEMHDNIEHRTVNVNTYIRCFCKNFLCT